MKQRIVQSVLAAVVVLLAIVLMVVPNTALAHSLTDSTEIALKTVYLHNVLEKAHGVMIKGKLDNRGGGKGKLILDPNICSLNDFGDRKNCTKMALFIYDVTFHGVKIADPSGMGRRLYEIRGAPLVNKLFLVVPTQKCTGFRLVSKDRSSVKRVVTLEPLKSPGKIAEKK